MGHIKITDLSVGDWVMYEGNHRKVALIDGVNGLIKFALSPNFVGTGVVEPIPITAELLKKNELDKMLTMYDVNKYITHIWVLYYGEIRIKKRNRVLLRAHVEYVHQLQHVLRLAGVDKEITL